MANMSDARACIKVENKCTIIYDDLQNIISCWCFDERYSRLRYPDPGCDQHNSWILDF